MRDRLAAVNTRVALDLEPYSSLSRAHARAARTLWTPWNDCKAVSTRLAGPFNRF